MRSHPCLKSPSAPDASTTPTTSICGSAVNPNGVIGNICPDFKLNPEHPRHPFVDFLGLEQQTEEFRGA